MARRRGSGSYYDDFHFPPPSKPREAKGGIKARSKRGAFGESWWARRWVGVLEGFHVGARLSRGKNYARRGQVTDIQVLEGEVTAEVQGSQARPYEVTIEVKTLSGAQWKKVLKELGKEALFIAKLLAGEMPEEIEGVFLAAGVSLFPSRSRDLVTDCSCPDWSNPCKHIAAVYYLLGEEFDRDPFLIFELRGMDREELMDKLGEFQEPEPAEGEAAAAGSGSAKGEEPPEKEESPTADSNVAVPLPSDPAVFWASGTAAPEEDLPDAAPAPGHSPKESLAADHQPEQVPAPTENPGAALVRRLGSFPFWRGKEGFQEVMERAYARSAQAGRETMEAIYASGALADVEKPTGGKGP